MKNKGFAISELSALRLGSYSLFPCKRIRNRRLLNSIRGENSCFVSFILFFFAFDSMNFEMPNIATIHGNFDDGQEFDK